MFNSIILLIMLSIVAWFWLDTLQCREVAKNICKQTCGRLKLQLLDDTIALKKMRLKRNYRGQLNVQRTYQFEFSDGGNNRQHGVVIMCGTVLEIVEIPGYMNRTISQV
jgi:hypothetical protein